MKSSVWQGSERSQFHRNDTRFLSDHFCLLQKTFTCFSLTFCAGSWHFLFLWLINRTRKSDFETQRNPGHTEQSERVCVQSKRCVKTRLRTLTCSAARVCGRRCSAVLFLAAVLDLFFKQTLWNLMISVQVRERLSQYLVGLVLLVLTASSAMLPQHPTCRREFVSKPFGSDFTKTDENLLKRWGKPYPESSSWLGSFCGSAGRLCMRRNWCQNASTFRLFEAAECVTIVTVRTGFSFLNEFKIFRQVNWILTGS